jgi:S1-C subfamily serine protease
MGDVVVELDGKKINSFDQLTKLVREKKVGDEVSLKIERDGETIEKKLNVPTN